MHLHIFSQYLPVALKASAIFPIFENDHKKIFLLRALSLFPFLKFYGIVFTLLLLVTSCSGGKKAISGIEKDLKNSPVFRQGFTGLAVYDPVEQEMIIEHNSEKYFTPASNIKLYTFFAGLKTLGDSIPALRYTIKNDSLIFRATGDPSLLNPDLPESEVPDFLINSDKKLFYLPQNTSEKAFGPGWAWDDYNASYSVERSTLPLYGNKVIFKFNKEQELPEVLPKQFLDSILPKKSETPRIIRKLHANQFQLPYIPTKDWQEVPFRTSEALSIQLLQDTLQRNIEILNTTAELSAKKPFYSLPADSLYKRMLVESDNFIAEQILLLVAEEISDTLETNIAIDHIKKNHLQDLPDKLLWVDGSGLSRYNLTTPRNMVKLLEKLKKEASYQRLFKLLPQGGKSGTLKEQYESPTPIIFAKTGSLSNNYSLSGYLITKQQKILIFSFMNSNYIVPSSVLKQEMERMLINIRNNF